MVLTQDANTNGDNEGAELKDHTEVIVKVGMDVTWVNSRLIVHLQFMFCTNFGKLCQGTYLTVLRIRDVYPESQIQGQTEPGSGSASKNLSIFHPKNCFLALGKIIWDVHPGSRFFPIPDPGVKKALDPGSGSATLVRVPFS